jgi:hypothetical protein
MDFSNNYIKMIQLLFKGAQVRVNINGKSTNYSPIQQGVQQGCPLAPYLFLIIGEVSNHCLKNKMQKGCIKGLMLPGIFEKQAILQYANNTSLSLHGEEQLVYNTILLLNTFNSGSGLFLNWEKSMAYF